MIESLESREFVKNEADGEYEHLVFSSDNGDYRLDVDVKNFVNGLKMITSSDIGIDKFKEDVVRSDFCYESSDVYIREDGEFRQAEGPDVYQLSDEVTSINFFLDDDYRKEFCCTEQNTIENGLYTVSIATYYGGIEDHNFNSFKPVEDLFPKFVHSEVSQDDIDQVMVDIMKYFGGEANIKGKEAIFGCDKNIIRECMGT